MEQKEDFVFDFVEPLEFTQSCVPPLYLPEEAELQLKPLSQDELDRMYDLYYTYYLNNMEYVKEQKRNGYPSNYSDEDLNEVIRALHTHFKGLAAQSVRYYHDANLGKLLNDCLQITYNYMLNCIQESQFRKILSDPMQLFQ